MGIEALLGATAGAISAAAHLLVTRWRARLWVAGRSGACLLLLPLALSAPLVVALVCLQHSRVLALGALVGLIAGHRILLRRLAR